MFKQWKGSTEWWKCKEALAIGHLAIRTQMGIRTAKWYHVSTSPSKDSVYRPSLLYRKLYETTAVGGCCVGRVGLETGASRWTCERSQFARKGWERFLTWRRWNKQNMSEISGDSWAWLRQVLLHRLISSREPLVSHPILCPWTQDLESFGKPPWDLEPHLYRSTKWV